MRPARVPSSVGAAGASPAAVASVKRGTAAPYEQTGDRASDQVQANTRRQTQGARSLPFGTGNLIRGVVFDGTNATVINHGLGTKFAGAFAMMGDVVASFHVDRTQKGADPGKTGSLDDRQISIVANLATTVDVWVYS